MLRIRRHLFGVPKTPHHSHFYSSYHTALLSRHTVSYCPHVAGKFHSSYVRAVSTTTTAHVATGDGAASVPDALHQCSTPAHLLSFLRTPPGTLDINDLAKIYRKQSSFVKQGYYRRNAANKRTIQQRREEARRLSEELAEKATAAVLERMGLQQTPERDDTLVRGITTIVDNAVSCHKELPEKLAAALFKAVSSQQSYLKSMVWHMA